MIRTTRYVLKPRNLDVQPVRGVGRSQRSSPRDFNYKREASWWNGPETDDVKYVPYVDHRSPLRRLGEEWPKGKPVHPDYYLFNTGAEAGSEVGFVCGVTFMALVGGVWIAGALSQ